MRGMIEPLWKDIIQGRRVNEFSIIEKEDPEGQKHKRGYRKSQCGEKQVSEGSY